MFSNSRITIFSNHLEYMRRIQSNRLHESVQTLTSIMPSSIDQCHEGEEDDKYAIRNRKFYCYSDSVPFSRYILPLLNPQYISNNSIEMIDIKNKNINSVIQIIDEHPSPSRSSIRQKCLLLFIFLLLLIIGLAVVICMIIIHSNQLRKDYF